MVSKNQYQPKSKILYLQIQVPIHYVPTQLVLNKHYADVKLFTYKSYSLYAYQQTIVSTYTVCIVTVINCMSVTILMMMEKQLH